MEPMTTNVILINKAVSSEKALYNETHTLQEVIINEAYSSKHMLSCAGPLSQIIKFVISVTSMNLEINLVKNIINYASVNK